MATLSQRASSHSWRCCAPRRSRFRHRDVSAEAASAQAQSLTFRVGSCSLPHPDKVETGGEDAFFVSTSSSVLGVADGVGGWRESGVDPGEYSRTLMRVACESLDSGEIDTENWEETLRQSLAVAHQKTRMPGSSTACIVGLNPGDCTISSINLGDSGFVVVRNGTVVFQTPPQLHYFDCPYQLGACPEYVEVTDYPSDAEAYTVNVQTGDTIVLGSDGLWDNCPLEEVTQLIPDQDDAVGDSAEIIAAAAREHADDPEYDSPYMQAAREEGLDLPWWEKVLTSQVKDGTFTLGRLTGGKLDDITVVVARVTEKVEEPETVEPEPEAVEPEVTAETSEAAPPTATATETSPTKTAPAKAEAPITPSDADKA